MYIMRKIYTELLIPRLSSLMKYHVLETATIDKWSSMIYRMFKSALNITGSNINADGLFSSLNLIALEDYNLILPLCETMVWLNSKTVT